MSQQDTVILHADDKRLWDAAREHARTLQMEANCILGFSGTFIAKKYNMNPESPDFQNLLNTGRLDKPRPTPVESEGPKELSTNEIRQN